MEEVEFPDGTAVEISKRVLEQGEDHDDCPFCLGRAAAHRGESNPFPDVEPADDSISRHETDHGLWAVGHSVGSKEPGGLLWYEQAEDGVLDERG